MKKLSVMLLLGLSAVMLLAGCGKKETVPEEVPSITGETIPESVPAETETETETAAEDVPPQEGMVRSTLDQRMDRRRDRRPAAHRGHGSQRFSRPSPLQPFPGRYSV